MNLQTTDKKVFDLINKEWDRQQFGLEMIASENYVSRPVLEAQGSILTNKYAEGYPGKRYYGGCHIVDQIEQLAIDRAKKIFNCQYANVQPHSGSQANMAVFFAVANAGDTILGMDLSHGGHLTHGSPVNFSGSLYKAFHYQLDQKTHRLNYDAILSKAREVKPKILIAGFSAYPRTLDFAKFREIADEVGATLVADISHVAGLVATGHYPTSIPYAHFTTTTTHKTLRGPRGGMILCNDENSAKLINSKIFPGIQGGPLEHIIAAKAVSFGEALAPEFKIYSEQVIKNAKTLAEALLEKDFNLITGGTDNHLILIDLNNKNITGKDAEIALDKANITVNKNTVPYDTRSPFVTSGIRIGTPALTSRGMKEAEMKQIAVWINDVVDNVTNEAQLAKIKKQVEEFCRDFPIYN